ncbi:hypothetical protein M407DRAFT_30551 [Tulasnella calospora MUT 4182]|uniref:F-box domain-containing protein n=1 Tax=Tulasnella calospora MUT 4182 TaxID=1051891 RepID=A0A0C3Q804_9AGAM|nr:hypothetical protein M407DRAFT_30551 [Tulasnella calospora MUT 4182]
MTRIYYRIVAQPEYHNREMTGLSDQWKGPHEPELLGSSNISPDQQTHLQSPIERLPAELLTIVLYLALPPIDLKVREDLDDPCTDYMKALYQLQLVSKRWKEVLDTTPGVWAVVSGGFPDQQNIANMDKSHNYSLTVYSTSTKLEETEDDVGSCLEFLQLIEHTRHRWRVLRLDGVLPGDLPHYLTEPAPILESIHISSFPGDPDDAEVLTLFGHHVSAIRHVDLMNIAFHPGPSPFHDLICFKLYDTRGNRIPIDWIMEVLRGSPRIERLWLVDMDLQMPTLSTPIAVMDLTHLKSFRICGIDGRAIEYITRRINAPNCIQFNFSFDGRDVEDYDTSLILDSALILFEPILQSLVHKMSNPSLSIGVDNIFWGQHPPLLDPKSRLNLFFLLDISGVPFVAVIRWVDRVVEPTHSNRGPDQRPLEGALGISSATPLADTEIVSRLKHLNSITQISAGTFDVDASQLFRMLAEAGPEPCFPHLRQLNVHAFRWEARELLEMVRARLSQPSQLVPHLTVVIQAETYPSFADPGNRVVFNPDILREIRAVKGVNVAFSGGEDNWELRILAFSLYVVSATIYSWTANTPIKEWINRSFKPLGMTIVVDHNPPDILMTVIQNRLAGNKLHKTVGVHHSTSYRLNF